MEARPTPVPEVSGARARSLLERLIVEQRASAAILRARGKESEARLAERFATRMSLTLDEPKVTRRMHSLTRVIHEAPHRSVLLEATLEGAMSLLGSDFGNVQLVHPATRVLRIAAEAGFSSEFLEYFRAVDDDGSACGRAAANAAQVVIADVNEDSGFAPHREIAAASGFRAVQSTPIVDPSGQLWGVISTHFRRPHQPRPRDLQILEWFGEHVGAALARQRLTVRYEDAAVLHGRVAGRHETSASIMEARGRALRGDGDGAKAIEHDEWAQSARDRADRARRRAQALAAEVEALREEW